MRDEKGKRMRTALDGKRNEGCDRRQGSVEDKGPAQIVAVAAQCCSLSWVWVRNASLVEAVHLQLKNGRELERECVKKRGRDRQKEKEKALAGQAVQSEPVQDVLPSCDMPCVHSSSGLIGRRARHWISPSIIDRNYI